MKSSPSVFATPLNAGVERPVLRYAIAAVTGLVLLTLALALVYGKRLDLPAVIFEHLLLGLILWRGFAAAQPHAHPLQPPFPLWKVLACYGALITVNVLFVAGQPLSGDEAAYVFQAKTLLTGQLSIEAPPGSEEFPRQYFFNHYVIRDGRWFSQYSIGWPAMLALGMPAGLENWINPVLGLIYLLLTYRVGREWFGETTGRIAALLLAVSPSFLHWAQGYLSHMFCGVLLVAAFWLAIVRRPAAWWGDLLPPLLVALAGASRLYTALAMGGVIFLLAAVRTGWNYRRLAWLFVCWAFSIGVLAGWTLFFNQMLMGDPLVSPYSGGGHHHFFVRSAGQFAHKLFTDFRWSIQSTLFYAGCWVVAMAVIACVGKNWRDYRILALASVFLVLVVGHVPFEFPSGEYFGERYYAEAYFALAILAAYGFLALRQRLGAGVARHILILFAVFQTGHLLIYGYRAHETGLPVVRTQQAVLAEAKRGNLIFVSYPLGRDLNLNAADWRSAGYLIFEDPGPKFRRQIAQRAGLERIVLLDYDPRTRQVRVRYEPVTP